MKIFVFCLYLCIAGYAAEAQQWLKVYDNTKDYFGELAIESHDKGILVLGVSNTKQIHSILNKTDVNGNILWTRTFGTNAYVYGICNTGDGGLALTGFVGNYPDNGDAFLLKLNACGEKEWSKIFKMSALSRGYEIHQLKDGGYLFGVIIGNTYDKMTSEIWRTDKNGNIIWKYAGLAMSADILIGRDNNILLTGNTVAVSSGPLMNQRDIYTTLLDSNGQELWIQKQSKTLYTALRTLQTFDKRYLTLEVFLNQNQPELHLLFRNSTGKLTNDKTIIDNNYSSWHLGDIVNAEDSNYNLIYSPDSDYAKHDTTATVYGRLRILKLNSQGDIINTAAYRGGVDLQGYYYLTPLSITATSDQKFLLMGNRATYIKALNNKIYVAKINPELEFDSFYTRKLWYDSLCTHTIKDSLYISLDTPGIVRPDTSGIKFSSFNLFPDPAQYYFDITARGFSNETFYLSMFDAIGRNILNNQFTPDAAGNLTERISVANIAVGCYFVRLRQGNNQFVKKLIVE